MATSTVRPPNGLMVGANRTNAPQRSAAIAIVKPSDGASPAKSRFVASNAGSPNPPVAQEPVASTSTAGSGVQSAVNAPVFVPKFTSAGPSNSPVPGTPLPLPGSRRVGPIRSKSIRRADSSTSNVSSRSHTPDFRPDPLANGFRMPGQYGQPEPGPYGDQQFRMNDGHFDRSGMPPQGPMHGINEFQPRMPPPPNMPYQPGPAMEPMPGPSNPTFFHNGGEPSHFTRHPLNYHLYAPPLPHVSAHHPHHIAMHNFFLSYALREELQRKMEATLQGLSRSDGLEVGDYFGVHPMDTPSDRPPKEQSGQPGTGVGFFGYRAWLYKAVKEKDGKCYALRRLEGFRLTSEAPLQMVEKWRRLRHPNLVGVREAFTTRAFGDSSIMFAFDYHPQSATLLETHLTPKPMQMRANGRVPQPLQPLAERVLWSYLVQLTGAIRAVHSAGLAVRTIEPSKILITGKNRLRINCCSIFDVVRADETAIPNLQQEDLFDLGKLLVALACGSPAAVSNLPRSLDHIGRQYSPDVQKTILYLFSKPSPSKTIDEVLSMLGPRVLDEFVASQNHSDSLEAELMREVENGRLVRLLTKFGFINERPEFDHDPKWSESGERYVIKLFRDFVFHQVDERGRPLMDLSHVLTCLNKLDAGVDERITLVSRDAQTCLVVSYREIKAAVEAAARDLRGGAPG